jgi:lipoprotein-releasing system permease protein
VYKLLLCWRYLRTRYLALVCIVSVMLGVATLIVVNSVMAGFSTKLRERLHGLLSDVVIEAYDHDGFSDPDGKMAKIKADPFLRDRIEVMTPTLEVFALIQFKFNGVPFLRVVHLIGIDPEGRAKLGGFSEHLVRPDNRAHPSFDMPPEALQRIEQTRQLNAEFERFQLEQQRAAGRGKPADLGWWALHEDEVRGVGFTFGLGGGVPGGALMSVPLLVKHHDAEHPDGIRWSPPVAQPPAPPQLDRIAPLQGEMRRGIIIGYALAHYRDPKSNVDRPTLLPGDPVTLLTIKGQTIGAGGNIAPVQDEFLVADYFKSEMSEYDANYVFVPLDYLQKIRGMQGRATSIQIRLKDYRDAKAVVARLKEPDMFGGQAVDVKTWEEKQGPLLAAISIEKGILNVLLFLIVGVAGFGILAIFSMIVFEKTRDIGILKALGASNFGVMKIFLGYGLLLGIVGSLLGTALGLTITIYINEIEKGLAVLTGQELFDRSVYYFNKIPTDIQPTTVVLVNLGAVAIAVLFSVLPALRAALLHPVQALRYE